MGDGGTVCSAVSRGVPVGDRGVDHLPDHPEHRGDAVHAGNRGTDLYGVSADLAGAKALAGVLSAGGFRVVVAGAGGAGGADPGGDGEAAGAERRDRPEHGADGFVRGVHAVRGDGAVWGEDLYDASIRGDGEVPVCAVLPGHLLPVLRVDEDVGGDVGGALQPIGQV